MTDIYDTNLVYFFIADITNHLQKIGQTFKVWLLTTLESWFIEEGIDLYIWHYTDTELFVVIGYICSKWSMKLVILYKLLVIRNLLIQFFVQLSICI